MGGEWQRYKLSDLGEVNRGRSRHRPRDASFLYGGPYPFIQTGDIRAAGGRITSHRQTYSEAGLAQSRLWPAQTVVVTIAANIAETGILTYPACFPDSVVGFIADPKKADACFMGYLFQHLKLQLQNEYVGSGSVQDNINLQTLGRLELTMPPLSEQVQIGQLLGSLDDKIELNRRMAETLEAMAHALFKSWFVNFDPVHAKVDGRSTGLSDDLAALFPNSFSQDGLPNGWMAKSLSELGSFLNGLALQKYPADDGGPSLPVVKIAELRTGPTPRSGKATAGIPPEYQVQDGDHLFSWSGSLTHCRWTYGRGALNQHLFKVTPYESYPVWLLYEAVERHMPEFRAIAAGKAVTMGHIQRHHLDEAKIAIPAASLLRAMDTVFAPVYERWLAADIQSRTLAKLRDNLLPKLISGELRVAGVEKKASAA